MSLTLDATRSDIGSRECYTATLFICYDLIRPDVAQYLSWKAGLNDFTMPCKLSCSFVALKWQTLMPPVCTCHRSSLCRTVTNGANGFARSSAQGLVDKNGAEGRTRSLAADPYGFKSTDVGLRRRVLRTRAQPKNRSSPASFPSVVSCSFGRRVVSVSILCLTHSFLYLLSVTLLLDFYNTNPQVFLQTFKSAASAALRPLSLLESENVATSAQFGIPIATI